MKINFWMFLILSIALIGFILELIKVIDNAKQKSYEEGYKAACADFYQGHLKYDLITNPDGTREWKKVK